MNEPPSFGRMLKDRRKARDLTQEALAEQVNCSVETIKKIEAGKLRPGKQLAELLADRLTVAPTDREAFIKAARAAQRIDSLLSMPSPTTLECQGSLLKGYELHERLGLGSFGVVYRATQPHLARAVAIKVILPQYANHPDFIRRFEAEAQLVARLEHPHIVPLYDYWREPGRAYLVMRYMPGGNLHGVLLAGPQSLDSNRRLLDQLAAALMYAHRHQIVHRDLKPANILLDEEGNAYLADFGIAKDLSIPTAGDRPPTGTILGSPAYLSPEQIRDESVTPQTDIYSLGVLLYELLTGAHPFADLPLAEILAKQLHEPLPPLQLRCPDLPEALNTVIQTATAKHPTDRYSDVMSLVMAWQQAVAPHEAATAWLQASHGIVPSSDSPPYLTTDTVATDNLTVTEFAVVENPYKGLRAFSEADAADFFGREALTQRLLERLDEADPAARFLAVVGPSGSGKSSVVRAGLIPALRRGGLPTSKQWFMTEMVPGPHPLEELEAGLLRVAVNPPPSLLEQLHADERGLLRAVKRVLPNDPDIQLVLIIDQFEELFTLVEDEATRSHLLNSMYVATTDPRSRLRVIITLRADFYDRPLVYPGMSDLVRQRTEVVLPLTQEELHAAIIRPAERVGVQLEATLVTRMLHDIGAQPGALPFLQYALTELFERRVEPLLTLEAYRARGGLQDALARRADEIFAGLDAAEQAAAQQLFLRLVTPGEGTEDTRRRVLRTELVSMVGAGESLDRVLDAYGRYRLLTFDRDPITRGPTVEVAHEALIRSWGQLRGWLDASRENLRVQRRLAMAAAEWITAGSDPSFLAQGLRLEQFRMLAEGGDVALNTTEYSYIQASVAEWEQHIANERARKEHEIQTLQQLAEAEKQRADEQSRVAVKLRQSSIGLTIAVIVALIGATAAGFLAEGNARFAATLQENLAHSESLRLAAAARSVLDRDGSRDLAALLAIRSLNSEYSPQADAALLQSHGFAGIETEPRVFTGHAGNVYGVAFSPDGKYVLTGSADKTARLWDAQSGQELRQFVGHTDTVRGVAFSPDGKYVLTGSEDKTARLWDTQSGQELRQFIGHTNAIFFVVFSPDGKYVLTGSWDGVARLWDAQSGQELRQFIGLGQYLNTVAFSPDGKYVLTGSADKTARLWDAQSGQELRQFVGHTDNVAGVAFSPDGKYVLAGSAGKTARLWDTQSGQELRQFVGHGEGVYQVAFSPDGKYVLTGSADKTARLWDAQSGQELRQFIGQPEFEPWVAFSSDGKYVLTSSAKTALLWNRDYHDTIVLICAHLPRDFTDAERTQYGIRDQAPTCPQGDTQATLTSVPPAQR